MNLKLTTGVKYLLIINFLIFLIFPNSNFISLYEMLSLHNINEGFNIYQLITYQFLHAGFLHIISNMIFLYFAGIMVERNLGTKKFIIYYLICGIFGGLFQLLSLPNGDSLIGASGSIFGITAMLTLYYPNIQFLYLFIIPMSLRHFFVITIIVEIFSAISSYDQVGHMCHIFGALTGIILFYLNKHKLKSGS